MYGNHVNESRESGLDLRCACEVRVGASGRGGKDSGGRREVAERWWRWWTRGVWPERRVEARHGRKRSSRGKEKSGLSRLIFDS